ncbi:MAG: M15 family metallopeptidase [Akkermansia sp.]|nr:M15 family metallopeptidase [Akkermansia sp.]
MWKLFQTAVLLTMLCNCSQVTPEQPAPAPGPEQVRKSAIPADLPAPGSDICKLMDGEGSRYMPAELCYLDDAVPGIRVNLRYCGCDNFVGRPLAGYTTGSRAILRRDTAACIAKAQEELNKKGLGLLVWDAYRPHRAMKDFYAWSHTDDDRMKSQFYPNITKRGIYEGKYIRRTSEHSLGVAVDVTIIDLATGQELDMGTGFDFLDPSSATRYTGITPEQHANRMLLRDVMDRAGMRNYKREWWHYFLKEKGKVKRYDFPLSDTLVPTPESPR